MSSSRSSASPTSPMAIPMSRTTSNFSTSSTTTTSSTYSYTSSASAAQSPSQSAICAFPCWPQGTTFSPKRQQTQAASSYISDEDLCIPDTRRFDARISNLFSIVDEPTGHTLEDQAPLRRYREERRVTFGSTHKTGRRKTSRKDGSSASTVSTRPS
ncbi:MAG: hypothetical protein M1817_005582 [Caeruleum heppii]|nr:MAG: hypothetical protein M1817_005582 [Caeruleum heppii]